MRNVVSVAVFATSFLGGACVAHAEDSGAAGIKAISGAQLDDFKGQYLLADGRVLTISGSGHKIHAQLDDQPQMALVSAGGAVFTAKDGSFRLTFAQHDNGNVSGVTLDEGRTGAPQHR